MDTTLVTIADLHVGHPYALCPARWTLHDGQEFHPSPLQDIIREHWCTTFSELGARRKKRRIVLAINGDVCEGDHHGTVQLITHRIDTQEAMAVSVLQEAMDLLRFDPKHDRVRFISGTHAHDGPGVASLERVARQLLHYNADRRLSHDHWLTSINGVLFSIAHRPGSGPGERNWTAGNAFQQWLRSLHMDYLERGKPTPRFVIRAHRHVYMRRDVYSSATGEIAMTGYILAPWKARDDYVVSIKPEAITNIGALVIDIDKNGATREYCARIAVEQDIVEEL